MNLPEIYFIRHAQSLQNQAVRKGSAYPYSDVTLSSIGYQEAMATRKKVASMDFDIIITSPLTRAIQTAYLINNGQPIWVCPYHRERVSNISDMGTSKSRLQENHPELDFSLLTSEYWWYTANPPENDIKLRIRANKFINYLKNIGKSNDISQIKKILVVVHGNFTQFLTGTKLNNCQMMKYQIPDIN